MTWRLRHEWKPGARVLGTRIATCPHCGALRATDETAEPAKIAFLRPIYDEERITETEPPCIPPPRQAAPW